MTVIVDNYQPKFVNFEKLKIGEIFKSHNFVFLKTSYSFSVTTNAINLSNRETSVFCGDDPVQVVNATITVEPC